MILKKRLVTKIILTLFSNQELSPLDIKTAFSCMKDIFKRQLALSVFMAQCVLALKNVGCINKTIKIIKSEKGLYQPISCYWFLFMPLGNIRKPELQKERYRNRRVQKGVQKETSDMKWVNLSKVINYKGTSVCFIDGVCRHL